MLNYEQQIMVLVVLGHSRPVIWGCIFCKAAFLGTSPFIRILWLVNQNWSRKTDTLRQPRIKLASSSVYAVSQLDHLNCCLYITVLPLLAQFSGRVEQNIFCLFSELVAWFVRALSLSLSVSLSLFWNIYGSSSQLPTQHRKFTTYIFFKKIYRCYFLRTGMFH